MAGRSTQKQKELADWQANFFIEKVRKIQNSIPQVCHDPLEYLDRAFRMWSPPDGRPSFQLKSTTVPQVAKLIADMKNGQCPLDMHMGETTLTLQL